MHCPVGQTERLLPSLQAAIPKQEADEAGAADKEFTAGNKPRLKRMPPSWAEHRVFLKHVVAAFQCLAVKGNAAVVTHAELERNPRSGSGEEGALPGKGPRQRSQGIATVVFLGIEKGLFPLLVGFGEIDDAGADFEGIFRPGRRGGCEILEVFGNGGGVRKFEIAPQTVGGGRNITKPVGVDTGSIEDAVNNGDFLNFSPQFFPAFKSASIISSIKFKLFSSIPQR